MKIVRCALDKNYRNENRLLLYFDTEEETNSVYTTIVSQIGATWYDYVWPSPYLVDIKASGLDLLLTDSHQIAISPDKRSGLTISSLGRMLLQKGLMSAECAKELDKFETELKEASEPQRPSFARR